MHSTNRTCDMLAGLAHAAFVEIALVTLSVPPSFAHALPGPVHLCAHFQGNIAACF